MSLEAIKQVAGAEQAAGEMITQRGQEAKRILAEAEATGRAGFEKTCAEFETKAAKLLAEAELEAGVLNQKRLSEAKAACEALKQKASGKLEAASDFIVGRIVSTDVH